MFVFLQEVAFAFHDELRNTYGSANNIDYLSKIETIESQYAFIKFGKLHRQALDSTLSGIWPNLEVTLLPYV